MPRDGNLTRTRIMDAAQDLILEQGFAATSVDRVLERASVTKGSFFYHFPTKQALAEALVRRWADADLDHLEIKLERATRLTTDPRERLLVFVGLFVEEAEGLSEGDPGCLFASYCYEVELFDAPVLEIIRATFAQWRTRLRPHFEEAARAYPPAEPVDPEELIDMLSVIFEGAFILSRVYRRPGIVAGQLRQYRQYLSLLFRA